MPDRRDERGQYRGEPRDLERERRIDRRADVYRGSDERGYGGGERLGRDWEREDLGGAERSGRGESLRSADEEHFARGARGGEERLSRGWEERGERRFRDTSRDVRQYSDFDRERQEHGYRELARDDLRASPSGAFHSGTRGFAEGSEHREHGHYSLVGLHDLDDLSELRDRYREHRSHPDYEPRYGHGPGVENMESPRLGYSTSMTRRDPSDREMGHGGFLGDTHRAGSPQPMGRGPKGYQRSDGRIREDICDRLMMSWMNSENVDVLVRDGEVTLQGSVKSRDEKRAIEALAESVLGVKDLINALRVERGDQPRTEAQSRQGQEEERRAQDQERTSAPQPGDTSMHS